MDETETLFVTPMTSSHRKKPSSDTRLTVPCSYDAETIPCFSTMRLGPRIWTEVLTHLGDHRLSPLARLLAAGVEDSADLAANLGCSAEAVEIARAELSETLIGMIDELTLE